MIENYFYLSQLKKNAISEIRKSSGSDILKKKMENVYVKTSYRTSISIVNNNSKYLQLFIEEYCREIPDYKLLYTSNRIKQFILKHKIVFVIYLSCFFRNLYLKFFKKYR